jgi:hypothetical protein
MNEIDLDRQKYLLEDGLDRTGKMPMVFGRKLPLTAK